MTLIYFTNYKTLLRVKSLMLLIIVMAGCVKFEAAQDVTKGETVAAPASTVDSSTDAKEVSNGRVELATHNFPKDTVFSFANIVKISFEIGSTYDPNGIIHVKSNDGATFLSASAATIGHIADFDVDTTYPIKSLNVIYEKDDQIKTKKLIVKKGVVNHVVLK